MSLSAGGSSSSSAPAPAPKRKYVVRLGVCSMDRKVYFGMMRKLMFKQLSKEEIDE